MGGTGDGVGSSTGASAVMGSMPVAGVTGATGAVPSAASAGGDAAAAGGHPPGTVPFPSPMVGTFYRSPSPDSEPFASAGTQFDEETTLCIIEAMKVMNEVKAESKGEIVEVLVENGEPVEFGQPLFLVKPR